MSELHFGKNHCEIAERHIFSRNSNDNEQLIIKYFPWHECFWKIWTFLTSFKMTQVENIEPGRENSN